VPNRAAHHQIIRAAATDELELARKVEMRVRERGLEPERTLVRVDRFGTATAVFEHDAEVEPVKADLPRSADREAVERLGLAELIAIVEEPTEVVTRVRPCRRGERALVGSDRGIRLLRGLERQAALVVLGGADRPKATAPGQLSAPAAQRYEIAHARTVASGSDTALRSDP